MGSVDTFRRFARAVQRLDLFATQTAGVTGPAEEGSEAVAAGSAPGAVEGVADTVSGRLTPKKG